MANLVPKWPNSPPLDSIPEAFTRFPDLPPEIQREIWTYLLPGPRVIHIMGSPRAKGQCFVDTIENPLLLRICQESRALACKRYRLSFEPHLRRPIYFNFSSDILLMQNEKVLSMFFERGKGPITSEVTMVKVIAIGLPFEETAASLPVISVISRVLFVMAIHTGVINAATRFGNLREILLLTTEPRRSDFENALLSDEYLAKMRMSYSGLQDPYALKRREFLKDEDGGIPTTTLMTAVDFWNRFP